MTDYKKAIILCGNTGVGKSSLANNLTNSNKFKVSDQRDSCTAICQTEYSTELSLWIMDTPGLNDTRNNGLKYTNNDLLVELLKFCREQKIRPCLVIYHTKYLDDIRDDIFLLQIWNLCDKSLSSPNDKLKFIVTSNNLDVQHSLDTLYKGIDYLRTTYSKDTNYSFDKSKILNHCGKEVNVFHINGSSKIYIILIII